jgi:VCBS repeat-containing protein
MKNIFKAVLLISIVAIFASCEKDEGKLPNIAFKTGGNYITSDVTKAGGSAILIGIDASKAEDKDVLKKFNITKSVNGAAGTTIVDQDLSGDNGDNFSYDYSATLDTIHGQTNKYTFTVTNRDGLTNQVALTVTVQ